MRILELKVGTSMKRARSPIQTLMKMICGLAHIVTSKTIHYLVSVHAAGWKDMSGFLI